MSVLKDKRLYLSGPIEFNADIDWRVKPKKKLVKEFGFDLFDPFDDPKQSKTGALLEARRTKNYKKMRKIAKQFVRKDLGKVDRCDVVVAYLPDGVRTTGTIHEIIESNNKKKPTLLVCPTGKEMLPYWLYGFIRTEFMFGSWKKLYEYLREVDAGIHKKNDRWAFIYGLI